MNEDAVDGDLRDSEYDFVDEDDSQTADGYGFA